nr:TonB family protein [Pinirhizobacter soli]
MRDINHYETLEVRDFASFEVIKGAHRHLCQRWHLDKNPDDRAQATERMVAINGAFHVLGNPVLKAEFDVQLLQRNAYANSANQSSPSPSAPPPYAAQPSPSAPRPPPAQTTRSEKVGVGAKPPGRARLYVYLYGLTMTLCVAAHFDFAGPAANTPMVMVGVLGMGLSLMVSSTGTAIRTVLVTFVLCMLTGLTSWMNAVPDAGRIVEAPVSSGSNPAPVPQPVATSPSEKPVLKAARPKEPFRTPVDNATAPNSSADLAQHAIPESATNESADVSPTGSVATVESAADVSSIPDQIAQVTMAPFHYPPQAVRQRHEGIVMLAVSVDETGRVTAISLSKSSGYAELDREAVRATPVYVVPAYEGGKAKATVVSIPVKFNLSGVTY